MEAAVVARPDDKWGETPCAFVTLKTTSVKSKKNEEAAKEKIAKFEFLILSFSDGPMPSPGKIRREGVLMSSPFVICSLLPKPKVSLWPFLFQSRQSRLIFPLLD